MCFHLCHVNCLSYLLSVFLPVYSVIYLFPRICSLFLLCHVYQSSSPSSSYHVICQSHHTSLSPFCLITSPVHIMMQLFSRLSILICIIFISIVPFFHSFHSIKRHSSAYYSVRLYLSIHLSLPVCPSVCTCLSICLYLSIHLSVPVYPSVFTCLSICLYLSTYLSVPVYPSVCTCLSIYMYLSIHLFTCLAYHPYPE